MHGRFEINEMVPGRSPGKCRRAYPQQEQRETNEPDGCTAPNYLFFYHFDAGFFMKGTLGGAPILESWYSNIPRFDERINRM
jgi:hypothetical protein